MCLVEGLKWVWDGLDAVLGVFGWIHSLEGIFLKDADQPHSSESSGRGRPTSLSACEHTETEHGGGRE